VLAFLSEVVLISLSGVMAPGPLTAVVVGKGSESPHAGAFIALGHGAVEIPLMVALLFGTNHLLDLPYVKPVIGILGAVFLFVMAFGMLRSLRGQVVSTARYVRSPFTAGVLLTIANPYFLVWWATIGITLIARSEIFGLWGFAALALSHWLCDFAWDYFLSALSFRGGQFFGKKFQKVVFAVCGIALVFFSARLMFDSVRGLIV
jgi:threonine/homoserine/homoserine lactone efflux protein